MPTVSGAYCYPHELVESLPRAVGHDICVHSTVNPVTAPIENDSFHFPLLALIIC